MADLENLEQIIKTNNVEAIRQIIQGGNINAAYGGGYTPLMIAVDLGNKEIVRMLIQAGADVNIEHRGETALGIIFENMIDDDDREIAMVLIDAGANLNQRDINGKTPLIDAVMMEEPKLVSKILIKGADMDARDNTGSTALMYASENGNKEIVTMLIDSNVNSVDRNDHSALYKAFLNNHNDIVDMLIQAGANINSELLRAAIINPSPIIDNLVRKLIQSGADVLTMDDEGNTPLMLALRRRNVNIAKLLIKKGGIGSNIITQDTRGDTPLMIALQKGDIDLAKLLIKDGGIGPNIKNNTGKTALMIAQEKGYDDIVKMIKDLGKATGQVAEQKADWRARKLIGEYTGHRGGKRTKKLSHGKKKQTRKHKRKNKTRVRKHKQKKHQKKSRRSTRK